MIEHLQSILTIGQQTEGLFTSVSNAILQINKNKITNKQVKAIGLIKEVIVDISKLSGGKANVIDALMRLKHELTDTQSPSTSTLSFISSQAKFLGTKSEVLDDVLHEIKTVTPAIGNYLHELVNIKSQLYSKLENPEFTRKLTIENIDTIILVLRKFKNLAEHAEDALRGRLPQPQWD
ncbi:hypothetical protein [Kordiimonas sp. SCSIO 12610]|uniref:hypothetical protein n=1 Tax=Kordiimonas sp. SCSIO 12610 TaxID=2829597 RepID=UPI00210E2B97|nr:hypothetical protein [Kordiimonas sp. SCSIO 12610]UTW56544.1 hypothetical protein KFF44_06495 [Kordiimonas sp. SCSIO 12610]